MGMAVAIIGLIIAGIVVGSLAFGAPWIAAPVALIFIGLIITKEQATRQNRILRMKRFRREARAQQVRFDATDKRTVV
jgi:FtsH-binding integral membrane protein